jgi:hypothetical protein
MNKDDNKIIEELYLYEGLICTRNISIVYSHMTQWNANKNIAFFIFGKGNKLENRLGVLLTKTLPEKELENDIKKLNNYGWFPSYYYSKNDMAKKHVYNEKELFSFYKNEEKTIIVFDAKYDYEVGMDNYEFLYHISPLTNKEKILKLGLSPKSKNKVTTHPNRVYLSFSNNDVKKLVGDNNFYPNEKIFIVFKIKLNELLKRREMKFFADPAFKDGIYTYENIPPHYIEIVDQITRN